MEIFESFSKRPDIKVELNKDLTKYSTLQLKSQGDLISVFSEDALSKVIKTLYAFNVKYCVLGKGSNILLREKSKIPYIKLAFTENIKDFYKINDEYILPASTPLNKMTAHAIKFGLKGWEVFTGIPASLGGAIFMNAGTNLGEIGSIVNWVNILNKKGNKKKIIVNKSSFSYRKNKFLSSGDVIIEASLKHFGIDETLGDKIKSYIETRNNTQPLDKKTCGCTFKNMITTNKENGMEITCRAGEYMDIMGLKGFRYKNLKISSLHANFIENEGGATYSDFIEFIKIINEKIEKKHGFFFETEVRL